MNRLYLIALSVSFAGLASCGLPDVTWTPRPMVASLQHATSCDELLTALREDASLKVEDHAAHLKMNYFMDSSLVGGFFGRFSSADSPAHFEVLGAARPDAPSHFTDTNTQVAGVDEPDFVKTDGLRIFAVHGRQISVFASWPAEETALVGSIEVEGDPVSLFLADDRLVVYSQIAFMDHASGVGSTSPPSFGAVADVWGGAYPYSFRPFTKITVLDVSADDPVVQSERYLEGSFRDARRDGEHVRTVVRSPTWDPRWSGETPSQWAPSGRQVGRRDYFEKVDAWLEERLAAIASRDISGFLPSEYIVVDGEHVAVEPSCDRFYSPEPGQSMYGMTTVLTTDLSALDERDAVTVLGDPSLVYASHDALLIAHRDWAWFGMGAGAPQSVLHAFALDAASTTYVGSGVVAGFLDDQFALDEKDGVFRVAITEQARDWGDTVNRVLTLAVEDGALVELGRTPDLAPGERIFSTRFVGDKAYVVTFRQVDPLFVVDLSDPTAPTVLGELKIPGFSTYMHPLSETHLLTIGRDDALGGLQLQIFDVGDPAAPQRTHVSVIGGYSAAEQDHKAFVFDPTTNLLAVPVERYFNPFESTLRLFHVSTEEGFTQVGAIDHTALFEGCLKYDGYSYYYDCGYSPSMRRGLFIDSYVYALSYGGLTVHSLDDLSTPLAIEPLQSPQQYAVPSY